MTEDEQDALFLAASRAHHAFQEKHWTYLKARDRRHPETGELYVQPNPAIDNEAHRLWAAMRDANWVRNGSR